MSVQACRGEQHTCGPATDHLRLDNPYIPSYVVVLVCPCGTPSYDSHSAGLASQLHALKLQAHVEHFAQGTWVHPTNATGYEADCGLHGLLRQALPQFTTLSSLEVQQLPDAFILQYAPPQLLELQAMVVGERHEE